MEKTRLMCYSLIMNKRNYSAEMDKIAADVTGIRRPSVLLHSCCGPCSSSVLERLTTDFDVTILWYNPNLYPESEYDKRLETQLELLDKSGMKDKVRILIEPWRSDDYYAVIEGTEDEPEGRRKRL